jgi:hypothetical protein
MTVCLRDENRGDSGGRHLISGWPFPGEVLSVVSARVAQLPFDCFSDASTMASHALKQVRCRVYPLSV